MNLIMSLMKKKETWIQSKIENGDVVAKLIR